MAGIPMPLKVAPYRHQRDAFDFVMQRFGIADSPQKGVMPMTTSSGGAALLMEMG